MGIELRQCQLEPINELSVGFSKYNRQIFQAPTGFGKTISFCEIVRRAVLKGTNVLIITHRIELFSSTLKELSNNNIEVQLINANNKVLKNDAKVNIAMVETLKRRILKGFTINPKLLIIDECHVASFNKVIDFYPNASVLGCSATPLGKHIYKYYNNIVCAIDTPELIKQGYLTPCKAFEMQDDISDLEKDSKGEYTEESLFKHYNKKERYKNVVEEYLNRINGLKTICFCVNKEHTINTCNAFKAVGISSEYVTSDTPKLERKKKFNDFTNNKYLVLVNCGIATTGYNEPSIQAVILDYSTTSLIKFLQTIGRGSRIYRNKPYFIVHDHGKNHSLHGLWSQPRKWTLDPPKKKSNKIGAAPIKKCTNCEAVISARASVCEFCGFEFPKKDNELKEGVLVEVKSKTSNGLEGKRLSELNMEELISLQNSKVYKSSYIWRIIRSKGEDSIKDYASKLGYKKGWIHRQIKDIENSQFSDKIIK